MTRSLLLCVSVLIGAGSLPTAWALDYPPAPRGTVVETLHGVEVADPYRWLEDNDAPETRDWVRAQNALSLPYLQALPERAAFHERLTALWNYARHGVPDERGDRRFYVHNNGLQNQSPLYVREADGRERLLLDPNALADDGTVALTQWQVSPDGRYLAYGLARAGSDWNQFRIRDVETAEDLPAVIERVKFSTIAWTGDSSGIFYSRYPDPPADVAAGVFDDLAHQAIHFHRLGSDPRQDPQVYATPDQPRWNHIAEVSDDGRWLVITTRQGAVSENAVQVRRLGGGEVPWEGQPLRTVVGDFEASYSLIGGVGDRLYFLTTDRAPRGRVLVADLGAREMRFREVVAESRETLQNAVLAGGDLVLLSMRDASHRLQRLRLDGTRREAIALPGLGSVSGLSGRPDSPWLRFAYAGFNQPATVYESRLDRADDRPRPLFERTLAFNPDDYVTEQVFYTSRDGTRVPLFISYRRGLDRSQPQRVHLYGYGGFDISLTPSFSAANLAWMERGGVYAVANLRGGGEYGRDWHRAGTREQKQNVFDDFIAAAGYLVDRGWTTPQQLSISGRSNGGLLVGAVVNQQPRLFGAAMAGVGVMDMLRFHRFTIGWAWVGDYGSADDAGMFPHLLRISPVHNVRRGTHYPPVLVTTGDHDDRVVPAHSYKYAAALQWAQSGDAPVLIRIDTQAGHGAGKPLSMVIDETADVLTFLWHHTGEP